MVIKRILKIVLIVLLVLVLIVGAYVAYVFIAWHRIPDHQDLDIHVGSRAIQLKQGIPFRIVSWNIGFGAYEDDYGFFMDGGTQSWAWSEERLEANLTAIGQLLREQDADLLIVQEIDTDSTRSYHVNELDRLTNSLEGLDYTWDYAVNYDSPFLFYPFTQPHGASKAGIASFSRFGIASAERRSLPIEESVMKLVDLDRCYSKTCTPISDGHGLVLYNFHLSAYTSDGTIATEQLRLLAEDMQAEYEAGNWCIAGGDFNKDILGDSSVYFGKSDIEYTWAQPIPEGTFDGTEMTLVAPLDEANPVPSCRNADGPYHQGQYVLTIDGFLVSPNVESVEARVIDTAFRHSDHNPVYMEFILR